jgi:hypothetical protein
MAYKTLILLLATLTVVACAETSSKPVEFLDERTGLTVAALKEPLEFVPNAQSAARTFGKRTSFAYLGPVEWDRSGNIEYGLWVHIAPGSTETVADLHAAAAVIMQLDGAPYELKAMDAPQLSTVAYTPVASWGQTAYFSLDVEVLKRMAAAQTLRLQFKVADGTTLEFFPTGNPREALSEFLRERGIAAE